MVRPRVVAVLRLMTSSIFVGCSTGSSAGCAPFRILSTKVAARRYCGGVGSITHEPANFDMLAITINRRQTCRCREAGNLRTSRKKGCVRWDKQPFNALRAKRRERRIKLVGIANLHGH